MDPLPSPAPGPRGPWREAEIIRWPDDADRLAVLRLDGTPRLLLMAAGTTPPLPHDDLEDWAWTPIDERDLFSRLQRLAALRPLRSRPEHGPAWIDGLGILHVDGMAVALPAVEAAILRALLTPVGHMRSREELQRAAWGDVAHKESSLDSRIFTLRRRIARHGLTIHVVRGEGFVLDDPGAHPPEAEGT